LILEWPIASPHVAAALDGARPWSREAVAALPALDAEAALSSMLPALDAEAARSSMTDDATPVGQAVRLAVPADIQALKRDAPAEAAAWRARVRAGLERAFAAGYRATALVRDGATAWYVLEPR
jgi:predicted GNAT superfamily acetyltransferase